MGKKLFLTLLAVALLVGCVAFAVSAEENVAMIGTTGYSTLQAAVNAYTDPATPIRLLADTAEAITVSKDVYLDLNGYDVSGKITVSGATLYCMDSKTDDYTVNDADGYGKLANVTGKVAGVPEEAACAQDGYLMVKEDNAYSFHRVNLQIDAMTLRPEEAGVYYSCDFAGDELVAAQVKSYGIALSVWAAPTKANLEASCKYTAFTDFQAGTNSQNSTLLKNVMTQANTQQVNEDHSNMPVYGRAYVLTQAGQYLFGQTQTHSFAELVKLAAAEGNWKKLNPTQKNAAVAMYRAYVPIMQKWGIKNVESYMSLNGDDPLVAPDKSSFKVLAVTSSFGLNTTQLLYDVAVAEGYKPENVTVARLYTSGCTLEKHINYAPDKPVYQYTKISGDPDVVAEHSAEGQVVGKMFQVKKEGQATLLDGLLDEPWDIIFIQQGARVASISSSYTDANGQDYITRLRNIMDPYVQAHCPDARFVWNMLWAYDKGSPQYPFNTTFNSDQDAMYQANVDCTMDYVIPRTDFDRIIPTGTAVQNARGSFFGETLSRDTYHLNNLGGTIAAYGMYAVLTGREITEINLDIVTASNKNGIGSAAKITNPFREDEKLVIMESVNNALRDPYHVTDSAYPPDDTASIKPTDNLSFIDDTNIAYCYACKTRAQWVEINQKNVKTLEAQGLFGTTITGSYHFYLSEDVAFTGANASSSMFHLGGAGGRVCVHLNGNDLTATNCAVSIIASTSKLNMMGTGTVSGNHNHASQKFRGAIFTLNSGTTSADPGVLRLYSGTYVQPADNTELAAVSTSFQGGLMEIFPDVTITAATGKYSVLLNTANNNNTLTKSYDEIANIYGGTFNGPVYTGRYLYESLNNTQLNITGGTFNDGIQINDQTDVNLTGSPVIKGAGLKIPAGVKITLETLEQGASIKVDATGVFTDANPLAADYLAYFSPVKTGYEILVENNIFSCNPVS